jgi:hypothetical protein
MADIAVTTAGKIRVVESIEQLTAPAGEAIVAGAPVRINTSGVFVNGNATDGTEGAIYGLATKSVAAGYAVTAVRKGVLDGFTLSSQAYNALIFVSNTDARIADAAGSQSIVVGRVIPGFAKQHGSNPDKMLLVDVGITTTHSHA